MLDVLSLFLTYFDINLDSYLAVMRWLQEGTIIRHAVASAHECGLL
jgi:hypothetical protein